MLSILSLEVFPFPQSLLPSISTSSTFLSIPSPSLPPYLPTSLPPNLPTSLPPYLPTSLTPYLLTSLPPYHVPTFLLPYLSNTDQPPYLPTYLPTPPPIKYPPSSYNFPLSLSIYACILTHLISCTIIISQNLTIYIHCILL